MIIPIVDSRADLAEGLVVLRKAKARLTDYNNWCPSGADRYVNDRHQVCAVVACVYAEPFRFGFATTLLNRAAKELYGVVNMASLNDGVEASTRHLSEKERYNMVMTCFEHAIRKVSDALAVT